MILEVGSNLADDVRKLESKGTKSSSDCDRTSWKGPNLTVSNELFLSFNEYGVSFLTSMSSRNGSPNLTDLTGFIWTAWTLVKLCILKKCPSYDASYLHGQELEVERERIHRVELKSVLLDARALDDLLFGKDEVVVLVRQASEVGELLVDVVALVVDL